MVDDTRLSKAMKFIVPHRMWLLQHDDDDNDDNSNQRWGSLVAVTLANMKEMIHTTSQLFQAFDKEKTTTTASPNTSDKNNNNNNMKMAQPTPDTTSKSKNLEVMESPLQLHWS